MCACAHQRDDSACADAVPLSPVRAVLSHIAHRRATVGDARTPHSPRLESKTRGRRPAVGMPASVPVTCGLNPCSMGTRGRYSWQQRRTCVVGRIDRRVSAWRALHTRAACQRVQMGRGNPAAGRARLSSLIAGRRWPGSAHASEGVARHQVAKCTHRRGTVFEHHEGRHA